MAPQCQTVVYGILVLEKTDAHEDMLCPSQHWSTLKEVLPSEPSRKTVRDTNKNNGPRGCKGVVQSATLCERNVGSEGEDADLVSQPFFF